MAIYRTYDAIATVQNPPSGVLNTDNFTMIAWINPFSRVHGSTIFGVNYGNGTSFFIGGCTVGALGIAIWCNGYNRGSVNIPYGTEVLTGVRRIAGAWNWFRIFEGGAIATTNWTTYYPTPVDNPSAVYVAGRNTNIDEATLWSRALSNAELQELSDLRPYSKIEPTKTFVSSGLSYTQDLVWVFHFDEGFGTNTYSTEGSGGNLTATLSSESWTTGYIEPTAPVDVFTYSGSLNIQFTNTANTSLFKDFLYNANLLINLIEESSYFIVDSATIYSYDGNIQYILLLESTFSFINFPIKIKIINTKMLDLIDMRTFLRKETRFNTIMRNNDNSTRLY